MPSVGPIYPYTYYHLIFFPVIRIWVICFRLYFKLFFPMWNILYCFKKPDINPNSDVFFGITINMTWRYRTDLCWGLWPCSGSGTPAGPRESSLSGNASNLRLFQTRATKDAALETPPLLHSCLPGVQTPKSLAPWSVIVGRCDKSYLASAWISLDSSNRMS